MRLIARRRRTSGTPGPRAKATRDSRSGRTAGRERIGLRRGTASDRCDLQGWRRRSSRSGRPRGISVEEARVLLRLAIAISERVLGRPEARSDARRRTGRCGDRDAGGNDRGCGSSSTRTTSRSSSVILGDAARTPRTPPTSTCPSRRIPRSFPADASSPPGWRDRRPPRCPDGSHRARPLPRADRRRRGRSGERRAGGTGRRRHRDTAEVPE